MGRHSAPGRTGRDDSPEPPLDGRGPASGHAAAPTGRRRRTATGPEGPKGHPEHPEHRAWGGAPRPAAVPGPRPDYLAAFDGPSVPYRGSPVGPAAEPGRPSVPAPRSAPPPQTAETPERAETPEEAGTPEEAETAEVPGRARRKAAGGVTGIAASAVVTVLAVVVALQVAGHGHGHGEAAPAKGSVGRTDGQAASRSDQRPALTYDQAMAARYPLDPKLALTGSFAAVPGHDPAPGRGTVLRYRVDVEKGLPLDAALFAQAVHKTLNDDRSWGHGGTRTFERVSDGRPDFVITLASPGTTAKWCAKSGLDTADENVSCDSAATDRVMINAYRWAQGSPTYGADRMHMYRQMLINHEVGHRLGHNHEKCPAQGALAPVMMQQTKFLTTDGVTCRPNPWPFPQG